MIQLSKPVRNALVIAGIVLTSNLMVEGLPSIEQLYQAIIAAAMTFFIELANQYGLKYTGKKKSKKGQSTFFF